MENGADLLKLEKVVEQLFEKFNQIKKEKVELEAVLSTKDQTIEELNAKISSLSTNQQDISSRVTSLISSIEGWEGEVSSDEEAVIPIESTPSELEEKEDNSPQEAQLF